jgi:hypothetical protein
MLKSLAIAWHSLVLPTPLTPYKMIPLGGIIPYSATSNGEYINSYNN